jgi:hypothetical protein
MKFELAVMWSSIMKRTTAINVVGFVIFASAVLSGPRAAEASTITFDLTQNGAALFGAGSGPYGSVTFTDNGTGTLSVTETLNSNYDFNKNNNPQHNALTFDLSATTIKISNLTAGFTVNGGTLASSVWTVSSGARNNTPEGSFDYAIIAPTAANNPGPLSFTISDAANDLTLNSLEFSVANNGDHIWVASDIANAAGVTGAVGAVPELSTWGMMALGFLGVGLLAYRRTNGALRLV